MESAAGRWIVRGWKVAVAVLLVVYLLDAAWFYIRRTYPGAGKATGSVHRVRLLAIANKGGKTEFRVDAVQPEEDLPCANSLFWQGGQRPCWYVARHANDPIPI